MASSSVRRSYSPPRSQHSAPMNRPPSLQALLVLIALASGATLAAESPPGASGARPQCFRTIVWRGGEDGMIMYHVPGIYVARSSTVFAYADARYGNASDFGPHHVVLKRSTDGGVTWSRNQFLGLSDHGQTFLFPNMIQPRGSQRLYFFYAEKDPAHFNTRTFVWLRHSDDDGVSWSEPIAVQNLLVRADAALQRRLETNPGGNFAGEGPTLYGREQFYPGPGGAIQLRPDNPAAPDRIVVPILMIKNRVGPVARRGMSDTILYSDDAGCTWKAGGAVPMNHIGISEPDIIELQNGDLLFNARVEDQKRRAVSVSHDGGLTWNPARLDDSNLPHHTICFASLRRYRFGRPGGPDADGLLLYCCPFDPDRRRNLSIFLSTDDGRSWRFARTIDPSYSDYSNLAVYHREIYLIYGKNTGNPKETVFERFNLAWLTSSP